MFGYACMLVSKIIRSIGLEPDQVCITTSVSTEIKKYARHLFRSGYIPQELQKAGRGPQIWDTVMDGIKA